MTDQAQQFVDSLDLEYSAEFVPLSQSRNADNPDPSINWKVSLGSLEVDYMQGIGHLPGYRRDGRLAIFESALYHRQLKKAAENGQGISKSYPFGLAGKIPEPALTDVLYSLIIDSDALNYPTFEQWAESCGFDTDSRKAEKIYRECLETAVHLRQLIDLDKAQKAFEDY